MPLPGLIAQFSPTPSENRRAVSWQGWQLEISRRWDPVKFDGGYSEGYALFADARRPRLGIRWQTPRKSVEPAKAVTLALRGEVGQLAGAEAVSVALPGDGWQASLNYTEPQPPGRDVFSGFSATSGRLIQIAYHAHRRERVFADCILPTLVDLPAERAMPWSIFDLRCVVPGGMRLQSQRLNAGDLGLTFADRNHELTIRQIAVASLALRRQGLDGWIADQQRTHTRYHRPTGIFSDTTITTAGREIEARLSRADRRRRFVMLWDQPKSLTTIAAVDRVRDRLVILDGTDESLLRVVADSVGGGIG